MLSHLYLPFPQWWLLCSTKKHWTLCSIYLRKPMSTVGFKIILLIEMYPGTISLSNWSWIVGFNAVATAMKALACKRLLERQKHRLRSRQLRLAFAHLYRDWSVGQWLNVLFSDETWVMPRNHGNRWITRRDGETYSQTCTHDNTRQPGRMFWGSIYQAVRDDMLFGTRPGELSLQLPIRTI